MSQRVKRVMAASFILAVLAVSLTRDARGADQPAASRSDASSGWYAGFGFGSFHLHMDAPAILHSSFPAGISQAHSVLGGFVKIGNAFQRHVSAEFRLGAAGGGDDVYIIPNALAPNLVSSTLSDSFFLSYLLRVSTASWKHVHAYVLLGGTTAELRSTFFDASFPFGTTSSRTGFTWGGGVEGAIADRVTIGTEYVRYWNGGVGVGNSTTGSIDGLAGVLAYHF